VGIPARVASGYGQGEYDAERRAFRVRENNAHTWVEVYFPDYGWIEFEPTVSEPPIIRPERPEDELAEESASSMTEEDEMDALKDEMRGRPQPDEEFDWRITPLADERGPLVWPWVLGLSLVAAVGGGWWAAENWGFRNLPTVERVYGRVLRFGEWLGRPLHVSDTPLEWARDVGAVVPEAQEPIGRIVDLYVHARFARGAAADPAAKAAWKQARPVLWRTWLKRFSPIDLDRT
jgi:hypothetical protein